MPAKRVHHYVPKSYQKLWTTAGRLFVRDVNGSAVRKTSPKPTAAERDLYRIVYGSGSIDVSVEDMLATIEDAGGLAIDALIDGRSLNDSERASFALHASLLHTRVPVFLDAFARSEAAALRQRVHDIIPNEEAARDWLATQKDLPSHLASLTPRDVVSLVHGDGYSFRIPVAYRVLAALMAARELSNTLLSCHWLLLSTPERSRLITSDNPMVITRRVLPGLPISQTVYELALGPHLLFRTGLPGFTVYRGVLPEAEVRAFNQRVSESAKRLVIGSDPSDLTQPTS